MHTPMTLTTIEFLSPILHELVKVGVHLVTSDGLPSLTYMKEHHKNPLLPLTASFFRNSILQKSLNKQMLPFIFSTSFQENFVMLPVTLDSSSMIEHDLATHYWIFGPSAFSHLDVQELEMIFTSHTGDAPFSLKERRHFHHYQTQLPLIDYQNLLRLSQLVCYFNTNNYLDIHTLFDASPANGMSLETQLQKSSIDHRMQDFRHHTLEHEQRMLTCVRTGNVTDLEKMLEYPLDGEYGILSKSNILRSQKNLQICAITLATRAAIEGGLNTELALTLSDLMIQTIESIQDIPNVMHFFYQSLLDLTKRVAQIRQQHHTKPVLMALDYVEQHLDQCLTLQDVAARVVLSPHYLSECFKAEMNITFRDYVQRRKIEEAKQLMASPTYSLLEISTSLGFHDQSHFTKMFKKWTGKTPKQFQA